MEVELNAFDRSGREVRLQASEGGILGFMDTARLWTAKGYGYQMMSTTAVAALVVRPSTAAAAVLFNNESGGGKHYVIERVFAHMLVTDVTELGSIWLVVHPVGMTAPGNDITTARSSMSGKAGGGSVSQWGVAAETVGEDGWFPWGNTVLSPLDGTVPSGHCEAPINGRIILPPQAGLSMHVVASTTTDTFTIGAHWFEVPAIELQIN